MSLTPTRSRAGLQVDDEATPMPSPMSPMLQAVEPEALAAEEEDEVETIELPMVADGVSWPVDPSSGAGGLYSSSLWHGVAQVLVQAESGRVASKAFVQMVRGKAELDREYAQRLRSLAATYGQKLGLPVRPRATNTFQAACCAIRNLHQNIASNSDALADQIEEQVADVFLEEAQELSSVLKPLIATTKATQARYATAMATLDQSKRDLVRACQELDEAKHSNATASDPMDFLAQMIRSTPDSLAKKVTEKDNAHMLAIKRVREMRARHDAEIQGHLAELEALELKRMTKSLASATSLTRIHQQCYTSHLKNIGVVHQLLQKNIRPVEDLKVFVEETVRELKGVTKPPSLPVYRLVKGHPNWERQKQQLMGKKKRSASGSGVTGGSLPASDSEEVDEPTDSDDDGEELDDAAGDSSHEITLSGTEEDSDASDQEESDQEDGGDEPSIVDHDSIHAAVAARSQSKAFSLTSAQSSAIRSTLAALAGLPAFSTETAASPVTLEPERTHAMEAMLGEKGRMAVAREVKRLLQENQKKILAAQGTTTEAEESKEEVEADAAAADVVPSSPALLVSLAALDGLTSFLTAMFDAAAPSMHVQPVLSVMRSAKKILCSEATHATPSVGDEATPATPTKATSKDATPTPKSKGKKGKKGNSGSTGGSEESPSASDASLPPAAGSEFVDLLTVTASSSSSVVPPADLYTRLLSHSIFTSARYYEVAFLATLDRTWQSSKNHAAVTVQRWHTEKEAQARAKKQQELAGDLLMKAAEEAQQMARVDDQTIVNFVAKMAAINGIDAACQAKMVDSLACFQRLGITDMPLMAGTARPLVSGAARSPTAPATPNRGASSNTPSNPPVAAVAMPVAQPVAAKK